MSRVKLSDDVKPVEYKLDLNVEESIFSGVVTIVCKAIKSLTTFEINSKELNLNNVKIHKGEKEIKATWKNSEVENKKEDFIAITAAEPIDGEFILTIEYDGKYGNLDGFYKKESPDGNLFSTQFEPTDARKAFPCFDQPDMKATFDLSITVPEEYMALGNGEVKSVTKVEENKSKYVFEKTPKMSTYITAWVIGKLKCTERKDDNLVVRVWCKEEELPWTNYALEVGYNCLKFFENYFNIKYPLPKADMVSIPSFASGAMENWGLITYRKTSLLFDPKTSAIRSKKIIANTVCHELAHMWFGNLVTMKWWNDLWLNEGFATWASSLAMRNLAKTHPHLIDWDEVANFASSDIEGGMLADCLENTHPIEVEVSNPDEIDEIFDAISYDKGSSVIKMLEFWMGPDQFRDGIRKYLKEKSYQNAETVDLWKALDTAQTTKIISIPDLMTQWISKGGFPSIIVEDKGNEIIIRQERFTKGHPSDDSLWPIPLAIKWYTKNGEEKDEEKILFKDKTMTLVKKHDLYKLNDGMNSFIRIQYPNKMFAELLKISNMSSVNVLNLIADLYEFGFALKGDFMFETIGELKKVKNYEVMENVLLNLQVLKSAFYDMPEINNKFKMMQNDLISDILAKVDLNNKENKDVNALEIDSIAVTIGVNNGIFSVDTEDVHQEFRKNYYTSQVDKDFNMVKNAYETLNLPGLKERALMALGKTTKEENFNSIFKPVGENGEVPFTFLQKHDVHYFSFAFGGNEKFRNQYAMWVMNNFSAFKNYINDPGMFRSVISSAFSSIHEPVMRDKVIAFLKDLEKSPDNSAFKRVILKVLDNLNVIGNLRKKIIEDIKQNAHKEVI